MGALRKSSGLTIVAMIVVVALAVAFWSLLLSPKRDEASKLGEQVAQAETSLADHREEVADGERARKRFPVDYQRLVVLGKAVPAGDETASLLVQLNGVADHAKVEFDGISLNAEGGGSEEEESSASTSGESVSPTEAAASLLPLGASIGPAGLAVMPYSLVFKGNFFQIADFIHGIDGLVKSHGEKVAVKGRLVTINSFVLAPEGEAAGTAGHKGGRSPVLTAAISVTTYVTPPGQGTTAGASPSSPEEAGTATPTATTTGGAP
jgi:Tfp pilus assembly protein PilO